MPAGNALYRRCLLKAAGLAAVCAPVLHLRAAPVGRAVDLDAPEPIAQLLADGGEDLLAMSSAGSLWRHRAGRWRRLADGLAPGAPIASGHGRVAGRSAGGGLWVLEGGNVSVVERVQLAPHAGMSILAFGIVAIADEGGAGRPIRFDPGAGGRWSLSARGVDAVLPDARPLQVDLDAARFAPGAGHIVVLAGPDDRRYPHGVLGDAVEATRVLYLERHGLQVLHSFELSAPHVFEDVAPRPIAWAGRTGLLTVRSGPLGAQLAVLARGERPGASLELAALGPPIGTPNRWMVPHTNGVDLLAVHTPHIGGVLQEYTLSGGAALSARAVANDCSTHVIGRREMGLAAWLGDALVLPDQSRRRARVLASGGGWPERASIDLPAPIASMHETMHDGAPAAALVLDDGRVLALSEGGQDDERLLRPGTARTAAGRIARRRSRARVRGRAGPSRLQRIPGRRGAGSGRGDPAGRPAEGRHPGDRRAPLRARRARLAGCRRPGARRAPRRHRQGLPGAHPELARGRQRSLRRHADRHHLVPAVRHGHGLRVAGR